MFTTTVASELRVDLTQADGTTWYAEYTTFGVGNAGSSYVLSVDGYTGDIPDCVGSGGSGMGYHDGMPFSTFDADNENWGNNCASAFQGA